MDPQETKMWGALRSALALRLWDHDLPAWEALSHESWFLLEGAADYMLSNAERMSIPPRARMLRMNQAHISSRAEIRLLSWRRAKWLEEDEEDADPWSAWRMAQKEWHGEDPYESEDLEDKWAHQWCEGLYLDDLEHFACGAEAWAKVMQDRGRFDEDDEKSLRSLGHLKRLVVSDEVAAQHHFGHDCGNFPFLRHNNSLEEISVPFHLVTGQLRDGPWWGGYPDFQMSKLLPFTNRSLKRLEIRAPQLWELSLAKDPRQVLEELVEHLAWAFPEERCHSGFWGYWSRRASVRILMPCEPTPAWINLWNETSYSSEHFPAYLHQLRAFQDWKLPPLEEDPSYELPEDGGGQAYQIRWGQDGLLPSTPRLRDSWLRGLIERRQVEAALGDHVQRLLASTKKNRKRRK
jgi:hypothetical protein